MERPLLIDRYLRELRHELWGSPGRKASILWEVEDHLLEGAHREQERGAAPEEAQRRAIERFGLPRVVAELFAAEIAAGGGGNMWQRFTERSRNVVFFAQGEAARHRESFVGTEHLLLGLVHQDNLAVRILECLGVSAARIRGDLEQQMTEGPGGFGGEMQLTPHSKRVIDLAYEEAQSMKHDYIGTEHLLLGLIREGEGMGAKVLASLGVELERTRREMWAVMPIWAEITKARQALEMNEALYRALVAGPTTRPAPPAVAEEDGEPQDSGAVEGDE